MRFGKSNKSIQSVEMDPGAENTNNQALGQIAEFRECNILNVGYKNCCC